jgi:N-acetylglucosamine-6-phosphate deacetylase
MKSNPPLPAKKIACHGLLATAGFIDLQVNGCGGVLLNDQITVATLNTMQSTNLQSGTTQCLPTFITSSFDDLQQVINLYDSLTDEKKQVFIGLHLEGPFINQVKKGAHPAQHIRQLDNKTAHFLASHANIIKVITLAPECVAQSEIDCLTNAGIIVSLGHSNATYQQLQNKKGTTMATHLYNAMSPFTSREPGAVGYVLDQSLYAGIVVDGIHCAHANVRIAATLLKEKLFLVTDAVAPAGTNMTEFTVADTTIFVTEGKCHFQNGTIAGSILTMIQGVKNLINDVGLTREQALNMASYYPAQAINISDHYGRLKVGYKANINLLDAHNNIHRVYQMGKESIISAE